jgi:hypothetical protein
MVVMIITSEIKVAYQENDNAIDKSNKFAKPVNITKICYMVKISSN